MDLCRRRVSAEEFDLAELDYMPTLDAICRAPLQTRDFIGEGLFGKAEQQFNRCVARVLLHNCADVDEFVHTDRDTLAKKRSRMEWQDLWMCPKVCLRIFPGGKSKQNRNNSVLASRLDCWAAGQCKGFGTRLAR